MGIRLIVGSAYSLDMSDYDFTGVEDAEITKFTSSTIKGVAGQFALTVRGNDFSHDQQGYLTGGTVYSLSLIYHGDSMLSLSGAHLSIEKLIEVLNTSSTSDDIALLKSTLGGDDYLSGSRYGDNIYAYGGDDTLLGRDGSDKITGGTGDDKITGGADRDYLHGDDGKDTFIFKSVSDSRTAAADTIYDFSIRKGDRIDLSEIDADSKKHGGQAFDFIGDHQFHDKAGELRFEKSGHGTFIYGDTDGDGEADLAIHLNGHVSLKGSAFEL